MCRHRRNEISLRSWRNCICSRSFGGEAAILAALPREARAEGARKRGVSSPFSVRLQSVSSPFSAQLLLLYHRLRRLEWNDQDLCTYHWLFRGFTPGHPRTPPGKPREHAGNGALLTFVLYRGVGNERTSFGNERTRGQACIPGICSSLVAANRFQNPVW